MKPMTRLREQFKAIRLRKIEQTRCLDEEHFNPEVLSPTLSVPQETAISPHPDAHRDTFSLQTSPSAVSLPQEAPASLQPPHTHAYEDTVNVQMLSPTSSQLQGPEPKLSPLARIKTRRDIDAYKGSTMNRLWKKAGGQSVLVRSFREAYLLFFVQKSPSPDVIQVMVPEKLLRTFSTIRQSGGQRLSLAFHRSKSCHTGKAASNTSAGSATP